MQRQNYLFTSESVSEGHPDKVCDQISDAILDAFLANDIKLGIAGDSLVNTRLGCETLCTTNKIVIAGEGRGHESERKSQCFPPAKPPCLRSNAEYCNSAHFASLLILMTNANAQDARGVWERDTGTARVQIGACGERTQQGSPEGQYRTEPHRGHETLHVTP